MGIPQRLLATGLLGSALSGTLFAQVNVATYHNDVARTGQNTQETVLTPANVNSNLFGKLLSVPVDGVVYAQPLYLSAINIGGGRHNVLYVATEHDSVYAIDADTGTIYAQVSLLPAGGSTVNSGTDLGCSDLVQEVGITGTPVIDPASGTLYVVASSKVGSTFLQYLHALDVTTLQEKLNGPVAIQASVAGTGYDATASRITFNAKQENQRPALLLDAGHVVITWAAHCDTDPYHGWIISYNAATLAQEATLNTSPNGNRGGIWMSGAGPSADGAGNIYLATGNGTWNGSSDLGDSVLKLSAPSGGSFGVLDYFTPYDQGTLASEDKDLGAGGLMVLPPLPSGQQLLAQQGKAGTIYLLDSSNLGKYCINLMPACSNNDPQIVQEIVDASAGIWGAPAYWNGNVYWAGTNDTVKAYSLNAGGSGMLSVSPTSHTAQSFGYPGLTPAISANGNANAILWGLHASPATLYAYDATNLGNLLYNSAQAANNRDSPGSTVKFVSPVIANGKVYFGTQNSVVAYGLLSASVSPAASPVLSPAPGIYTSAQSVALTDSTPGAAIYYTTDGTTPSVHSTVYAGTPLPITVSTTVQALAAASGFSNSAVSSGSYVINAQGIGTVSVNLSSVDNVTGIAADGTTVQNAGLDGDSYAYSATLLGTSISWAGSSFSLTGPGSLNAVTGATIALPPGNDTTVNLLATAVNGAQKNQTFIVTYTDGTTSSFTQSLSDWFAPQNFTGESQVAKMAYRIGPTGAKQNGPWYLYGYSFAVNSAKVIRSIALPKNRDVVVLAVDVSSSGSAPPPPPPPAASPAFSPAPGVYSSAQRVTLSDSTPGAVIYYTTDGTTPSIHSAVFSAGTPLQINANTTVQALAVASGFSNSAVSSGSYTINAQGTGSVSVNLSPVDNAVGIVADGASVQDAGLDGDSYAYSATLLGSSINWSGASYSLGSAGSLNAATGATIALPAGNDATVTLLATAVNGAQKSQAFIITYTDGTTSSFTQSLSDWFAPQNFTGEAQAAKMAYRIGPTGAKQNGPWYLYGYSFAINSAKTVKSLTLPKNRNVVVLAVDVSGSGSAPPPAATPVFSPAPGVYTSAQSVTLSDSTPGAVIYYTTDGTTPSIHSAMFTAGTPLQINANTTVQALAVASGFSNSAVSSGSYTINAQGAGSVSVNLSPVDNVIGIVPDGATVEDAGLDGDSYAYSATLLGASISWSGSSFTLGSAGSLDAVTGATIALPPGNDTNVSLLATGANGAQKNQVFVVTYTDGTTSSFTQSLSDWFAPQNFTGESQVAKMAYRVTPSGARQNGPWYLYGYSFAVNSAKTVKSITLPKNRSVVVLAVDVSPAG
jgi:hypothetical protein